MARFDGKVALITGGARGQGRSHALALAVEGADIVICDMAAQLPTAPYPLATPHDLAATAAHVEGLGRRCLAQVADVRDAQAMQSLVQRVLAEFGHIDILIANAAIISYGRSWELTQAQWDEMVGVNLTGVWQACKAVIPGMIERGQGGCIVLVSSTAGLKGLPNLSHYTAAKHGVVGLMRSLAKELAPYHIRVNSVHPTAVRTDIVWNEATKRLFGGGELISDEQFLAMLQGLNLLPVALLEPEDISRVIAWLVSDDARYVTGVTLPIDAGSTIK